MSMFTGKYWLFNISSSLSTGIILNAARWALITWHHVPSTAPMLAWLYWLGVVALSVMWAVVWYRHYRRQEVQP